eukprot:scaffold38563_cov22-Cyclotella_meneghiniana.AAC.2
MSYWRSRQPLSLDLVSSDAVAATVGEANEEQVQQHSETPGSGGGDDVGIGTTLGSGAPANQVNKQPCTPENSNIRKNYSEFGSPKAQRILAEFGGVIMDETCLSSDDDSVSLAEANESALDDKDLAADELGPTSPMLRTPRKNKFARKS